MRRCLLELSLIKPRHGLLNTFHSLVDNLLFIQQDQWWKGEQCENQLIQMLQTWSLGESSVPLSPTFGDQSHTDIEVPVVMEGANNLNIRNTTLSEMAMEWNIQYNPPQETQDNTIGLEGASDLDLPCINNVSQDVHAHSAFETEDRSAFWEWTDTLKVFDNDPPSEAKPLSHKEGARATLNNNQCCTQ